MPTPLDAENPPEQDRKRGWPRGTAVASGLLIGAALGVTFDSIAAGAGAGVGFAAGAGVGLVIGSAIDANQARRK